MPSTFSPPREAQMYFAADGDSQVADNGPTAGINNWFRQLCAYSGNIRVIGQTGGFSGKTMAQVLSSYPTAGAPSNTTAAGHQYSPAVTGGKGVYFICAGTNDIPAPTSAATLLTKLNSLCDLAHADGYQKVVALTITPRTDWSAGSTNETQRLAYNASLNGGSSHADFVFDVTKLLSQGDAFDSGLHWTLAQHTQLAQELWAQLGGSPGSYYPSTKCNMPFGGTLNGSINYAQQFANWYASDDPGNLWRTGSGGVLGTITSFSTTTITMANTFSQGQLVRFSSTGTLPTGLAASTDYWVTAANATTFSVAASPGGSAISLSSGSGTHSVLACWVWVAPRAGVVEVSCRMMRTYHDSSDWWRLWIYKNGASAEMISSVQGAVYQVGGSARIIVSAGDLLDTRMEAVTSSGSQTVLSNPGFDELSFAYDELR